MYKKIYRAIKKYDTIVIARHIGVDPDAMASQIALKESIECTFPLKKVFVVGNGSAKFNYFGKLDKVEEMEHCLLIVLDTPDRRRVDSIGNISYDYSIKIDHHPYVETFCDLEYIDDTASSTCEIIMDLIEQTKLNATRSVAEKLFMGLVSDSNRFLFDNCTSKTFGLVSRYLEKYPMNLAELYQNLYMRPMAEVRLQGYIEENMIVTDNGVGYIKITNDLINKFGVDSASSGNMINNFNFIEEVLVWVTITEDSKNSIIRISIRSRGPEINAVAEKYNGGGHKYASGARVPTFEEAMLLIEELDEVSKNYIKNHLS